MENVTRDVVSDLWPVYVSGEASPDTRALVEAFIREDPEFARTLREGTMESFPRMEVPALAPDHELRTLALIASSVGRQQSLHLLHRRWIR